MFPFTYQESNSAMIQATIIMHTLGLDLASCVYRRPSGLCCSFSLCCGLWEPLGFSQYYRRAEEDRQTDSVAPKQTSSEGSCLSSLFSILNSSRCYFLYFRSCFLLWNNCLLLGWKSARVSL